MAVRSIQQRRYIKDLESVDLQVLGKIVSKSFETLTSDTYTKRAREGTGPET